MTAAPRSPVVLTQVETIRSLCMLGVFWFHLWSILPGAFPLVGEAVRYGNLCVVGFNIITGLVLSWPHLGPQARPLPGYGEFLRKRFFRICPQYYICLILWTLVALLAGGTEGLGFWFLAHLGFFQTLTATALYGLVPAYWWLGLLAQFYLTFPFILRLFFRFGPARAGGGLILLCFAAWGVLALYAAPRPGSTPALVEFLLYYNLPARLPEFALGMWLAAVLNGPVRDPARSSVSFLAALPRNPAFLAFIAAFAGLGLLMALAGDALPGNQSMPLAHIRSMGLVLIVFFLLFFHPASVRAGAVGWVAAIAKGSYGIYLLHQPMLAYGLSLLGDRLSPEAAYLVLFAGVGLASSYAAFGLDAAVAWYGNRGKAPR